MPDKIIIKGMAIAFFFVYLQSCLVGKNRSPYPVLVSTINNYTLNPDVSFTNDVSYVISSNDEELRANFYMTKTSIGTATVPDFAKQTVVAIILKPTEKVVSIDIKKAEIKEKMLNIYYTITDTTSWKTYNHTPTMIASVPKSLAVAGVTFYKNNIKDSTVLIRE